MGVPSGVIGRSPHQKLACDWSPEPPNRSSTEFVSVAWRFGFRLRSKAGDFRHAADADAVAQTGDRDLVGFVHHGRDRGAAFVVDDRTVIE
jgi:hypothetical protein